VRLLIDAQLTYRLTKWFVARGIDAIHTSTLMTGDRTLDGELSCLADGERRILVTKDADFVDSHFLRAEPAKLMLISIGDTSNGALESTLRTAPWRIECQF